MDRLSLQQQQEYCDREMRSTDGMEYTHLLLEARHLLQLRRQNKSVDSVAVPMLKKFPHFYKSIQTVAPNDVDEYERNLIELIGGLQQVQRGELTMTQFREQFEELLAKQYYHPE